MKKYFCKIIPAVLILFCACEYETLPTYSGIDQIYFEFADVEAGARSVGNSRTIKFGYDDIMKSDSIVRIRVKVMGTVTDFIRPVSFELDESINYEDEANDNGDIKIVQIGRDIELLHNESFIPAGSITGVISVKLHNTDFLNDITFAAPLRLVENEHFKTDYTHTRSAYINEIYNFDVGTMFYLYFDNASEMPNLWAHPSYFQHFTNAFGPYSRKKFELMTQVLTGCTREYFTYLPHENPTTVFSDRFPIMVMTAWGRAFSIFLREYELQHGEPMLEEDGTVMEGGNYT